MIELIDLAQGCSNRMCSIVHDSVVVLIKSAISPLAQDIEATYVMLGYPRSAITFLSCDAILHSRELLEYAVIGRSDRSR
jgi:hypothetical protein